MNESDREGIVHVSENGGITIPRELCEKHGIETPGYVRFRENENGDIVVEQVPSLRGMRGMAETDRRGTDILREGRERDR